MECKFYVGQKVVCVDADNVSGVWIDDAPTEGAIYTVASVHVDFGGHTVLWLSEISRHELARMKYGRSVGYSARRFRPAVETKTDISALKQIVADVFGGKVKEAV